MMESGDAATIEEAGRIMLFQRLWELAWKGETNRTIAEYHEYRQLLELWHQEKI